jgi:NADH-quinone oxidoreductase subunit K
MIPLAWYLTLSALLFALGALVVMTRRNALHLFMGIELMLNAGNLVLLTGARLHGGPEAPVAMLFVLALAAAEVAVGLALIVLTHRTRGTLDVGAINLLRG